MRVTLFFALGAALSGCAAETLSLIEQPPPPEEKTGALSVDAAFGIACAIVEDKTVQCWGGYSSAVSSFRHRLSATPVRVPGLENVRSFAIDRNHGCAAREDGTVACWGFNQHMQLGSPATDHLFHDTPIEVAGINNATQVAVGPVHSCALLADRTVRCWGTNSFHQLGGASEQTDSHVPIQVEQLDDVVAIDVGGWHSCGLRANGEVWCWGYNPFGELGNGSMETSALPGPVLGLDDVISIAMWNNSSAALTRDGKVWAFGVINRNELVAQRTPLELLTIPGATRLEASLWSKCVLKNDGTAACWGENRFGQLGIGVASEVELAVPSPVQEIRGVTELAIGFQSACAVHGDRTLSCWGLNSGGELGYGVAGAKTATTARSLFAEASAIAVGPGRSCAILTDGRVACSGANDGGQIGDGSTGHAASPVIVEGVEGAKSIALSLSFSCAIDRANDVVCWGDSERRPFRGAVAIAAGRRHACALDADGAVWCWGDNNAGQLGNGTWDASRVPVRVSITGASALVAGAEHTCAIAGGAMWCWGQNHDGQLGVPDNYDEPIDWQHIHMRSSPVEVSQLANVTSIAAGFQFTCARAEGGEVRCWGEYYDEFRGRSIDVARGAIRLSASSWGRSACAHSTGAAPLCFGREGALPSDPSWVDVAIGNHTCALDQGGRVSCFGASGFGELGDGDAFKSTPVRVLLAP